MKRFVSNFILSALMLSSIEASAWSLRDIFCHSGRVSVYEPASREGEVIDLSGRVSVYEPASREGEVIDLEPLVNAFKEELKAYLESLDNDLHRVNDLGILISIRGFLYISSIVVGINYEEHDFLKNCNKYEIGKIDKFVGGLSKFISDDSYFYFSNILEYYSNDSHGVPVIQCGYNFPFKGLFVESFNGCEVDVAENLTKLLLIMSHNDLVKQNNFKISSNKEIKNASDFHKAFELLTSDIKNLRLWLQRKLSGEDVFFFKERSRDNPTELLTEQCFSSNGYHDDDFALPGAVPKGYHKDAAGVIKMAVAERKKLLQSSSKTTPSVRHETGKVVVPPVFMKEENRVKLIDTGTSSRAYDWEEKNKAKQKSKRQRERKIHGIKGATQDTYNERILDKRRTLNNNWIAADH